MADYNCILRRIKQAQVEVAEAEQSLSQIRSCSTVFFKPATIRPPHQPPNTRSCIPILEQSYAAPLIQKQGSIWTNSFRSRFIARLAVLSKYTPLYEAFKCKSAAAAKTLARQPSTVPDDFKHTLRSKLELPDSTILIEKYAIPVTVHDLLSLQGSNWLNDNIINFYFELIRERSDASCRAPRIHIFNTYFYTKLRSAGYGGVSRWTRKTDIFSFDMILIPIHLSNHWCCAEINMKHRKVIFYDSLCGSSETHCRNLLNYIIAEHQDKKKFPMSHDDWAVSWPKNIPKQHNGFDCGVFACTFAEFRSRGAELSFSQQCIPDLRTRMSFEILAGRLA